ncbi:serine/threonine-protein kinase [Streptomyces sp. 2P-4]|uniref:serine/threonine-protein kinase n=1 Tax=Streptomyces sp. 2P-4 TaxID=2931974 RepID=UPI00253F7951|nr:serine/threonine-protein kinase [Streptomyces sp. 2P-4]
MLVAERYRLDAPIGSGGMGEVYRASDHVLGRPVAVKLLLGGAADPSAGDRFRLEAQTAARLNHPHVVGVFDFGSWDDRFYLVMELVEGASLAGELERDGRLSAERVARIAAQAAAGLAAAHGQGIVHRDIKPGNLLTDAAGTVKIADFGIAKFVDDPSAALTSTGQILGTGLYLAPERALGRQAGPASDVYSLGCVLYQLLTGHPPFQSDTTTGVLYQHVDAQPVPPRQLGTDLPAAFEAYLLRLLAKQPEDRPTAQHVAEWFATESWRGRAAPRPSTAPPTAYGKAPTGPTAAETAHMPALTAPPLAGGHRAAPGQSRRITAWVRSMPRATRLIAGIVVLVAASLMGMVWLSSEGSNKTPQADPSGSVISPPRPSPSLSSPGPTASDNPDGERKESEDEGGGKDRKKQHGKKGRGD